MKKETRTMVLVISALLAALCVWLFMYLAGSGRNGKERTLVIRVEADGVIILQEALGEDARFVIADKTARRVRDDQTAEDLLEEAAGKAREVNIIELRDGKAYCAASNCPNLICVHTPAITQEAYDAPIVCLPHRLTVYAVAE